MIVLGKYNVLKVLKRVEFGVYMDGGEGLEILMPTKYVPQDAREGVEIRCFVYQDAEARLIATTERPYVQVGEFANLLVKEVNKVGAFADWGVSKELLIPHREQKVPMEAGRRYFVYVYVDDVSGRIVGTGRIDKYLDNVPPTYEPNEEVEIQIYKPTPMGYKVIVNQMHTGQIYHNQIFRQLRIGDRLKAWIKGVREDDKLDIMLQPMGYRQVIDSVEAVLLQALHLHDGFLPLTDKSDPAEIAEVLQCSKKNFKKAVGALYKQGRIDIEPDGLRLLKS